LYQEEGKYTANINVVRWSHANNYIAIGSNQNAIALDVYSYIEPESAANIDYSIFDDINLTLNSNISWKMSTTFSGNCVLNAKGNEILLEDTGVISVTSNASLKISNATLSGLTSQNFKCVSDDASIEFVNCNINLDHDYEFENGSLLFTGDNSISGTNIFTYSTRMGSTISSNSKLNFNNSSTCKYSPPIANRDLLYMTDKSSQIYFDGCTVHSTSTGMRLTRGTVLIDNDVTFSCEGTNPDESICFGDGTSVDNDVEVKLLAGVDLSVYGGLQYNNVG